MHMCCAIRLHVKSNLIHELSTLCTQSGQHLKHNPQTLERFDIVPTTSGHDSHNYINREPVQRLTDPPQPIFKNSSDIRITIMTRFGSKTAR